jgi:hypothetical protein
MPTRIFEFIARGKAVAAPRTSGILDYFGEDELLFFKPEDPVDLARTLVLAHQNPTAVARVVERGQRVYLANRWSGERDRLVRLVRQLLAPAEVAVAR